MLEERSDVEMAELDGEMEEMELRHGVGRGWLDEIRMNWMIWVILGG